LNLLNDFSQAGAEVNGSSGALSSVLTVSSPLHTAISKGKWKAANALLDAGADFNGRQKQGSPPNRSIFHNPSLSFRRFDDSTTAPDSAEMLTFLRLLRAGHTVQLLPAFSMPTDFCLVSTKQVTMMKYILENPPPNYDINKVRLSNHKVKFTSFNIKRLEPNID